MLHDSQRALPCLGNYVGLPLAPEILGQCLLLGIYNVDTRQQICEHEDIREERSCEGLKEIRATLLDKVMQEAQRGSECAQGGCLVVENAVKVQNEGIY